MTNSKTKALSYNDQNLLQCSLDSNALSSKISRANSIINDFSEVDAVLLNDKKIAKKMLKLKKMLGEVEKLANEVTADYYDGIYARPYKF